jgi:hypothetical protein
MDKLDDLGLYFLVQTYIEGKMITDELIADGGNVLVTKSNFEDFIRKRLNY